MPQNGKNLALLALLIQLALSIILYRKFSHNNPQKHVILILYQIIIGRDIEEGFP